MVMFASELRALLAASVVILCLPGCDDDGLSVRHPIPEEWTQEYGEVLASGIWGSSESNVFAVGARWDILHYDGVTWKRTSVKNYPQLLDVWGVSPDSVFAVGVDGTILLYNDGIWRQMTSPTNENLFAVAGSSRRSVYAVGSNSTAVSFDGSVWSTVGAADGELLRDAWVTGDTLIAIADFKRVKRYDGSLWTVLYTLDSGALFSVWGFSGTDIFVVGSGGIVYHYDGAEWTQHAKRHHRNT